MSKRDFKTIIDGATYILPTYFFNKETYQNEQVGEQVINLLTINSEGTVHEALISMLISDLRYKNTLVPNRHTSVAITHLEEALFRLEERVREREANGTLGTYKS